MFFYSGSVTFLLTALGQLATKLVTTVEEKGILPRNAPIPKIKIRSMMI